TAGASNTTEGKSSFAKRVAAAGHLGAGFRVRRRAASCPERVPGALTYQHRRRRGLSARVCHRRGGKTPGTFSLSLDFHEVNQRIETTARSPRRKPRDNVRRTLH